VSNVKDIDLGYKRIMRELGFMSKHTVVAGVTDGGSFSDLSDREPGDLKGVNRALSITEIAAVQEYGTQDGKVPSRSFLRSTMDENEGQYVNQVKAAVKSIINGSGASRQLDALADAVTNDIKRKIDSGIPPPLKDGSGRTPLRKTGDLYNAVTGKVVRK